MMFSATKLNVVKYAGVKTINFNTSLNLSRCFSFSFKRQDEEVADLDAFSKDKSFFPGDSNSSVQVQIPTTDSLSAYEKSGNGIPGLLSKDVFKDIWTRQTKTRLEDLKYGISESPNLEELNTFFNTERQESAARVNAQRGMNPFLRTNRKFGGGFSGAGFANDFSLKSSNKVADQYYKLLEKTSKSQADDFVFQSASSIYNLFYFLSSVKSNTSDSNKFEKESLKGDFLKMPDVYASVPNAPTSGELLDMINTSFGSLKEFRTLFLDSANSIHGNGYTWLVRRFIKPQMGRGSKTINRFSSLAVLNTYNNGTPHQFRAKQISSARKYHEKRGMVENENSADQIFNLNQIDIPTVAEAQDSYESFEFVHEPLLSVGVNPSFYVRDYGVFGKKKYLENVWNCINWSVVEERLGKN